MAKVKVTQLKSLIGRKKNHRLSVKGLGLKLQEEAIRVKNQDPEEM